MKRHVLARPMAVADISDLDSFDDIENGATQKAERVRLKRWRRVKQQLA
jgi:hypothetical protein